MAKMYKQEEIIDKIMKIKNISDNQKTEYEQIIKEILTSDFSDKYDILMEKLFNEEYYR